LKFFAAVFLLAVAPAIRAQTSVSFTDSLSNAPTVDFSFAVNGGLPNSDTLAIFFDPNIYTNLVIPNQILPGYSAGTTSSPDWALQIFQPDPGIPAPSEFDITALTGAVTAYPFFVEADLLQGQSLTAPSFTLFDSNFNPIGSGAVQPAIPEPATWFLMGAGLTFWVIRHRRFPNAK
jgi:hypothetical protein